MHAPYFPADVRGVVGNCYESLSITPWKTYTWKPFAACTLLEFDRNKMCGLLQGQVLLVMGDSLNEELFHSLAYFMGYEGKKVNKPRKPNLIYLARFCRVRLIYSKQHYLQDVSEALVEHEPTIVIMNRGAHYVPDDALVRDMRVLIQTMDNYTAFFPTTRVIWRTSVPGHPSCWDHNDGPDNNVQQMANLVANRSLYNFFTAGGQTAESYHWWEFQHQNQLVLEMLLSSNSSSRFEVMDAYDLLLLRPDLHRGKMPQFYDCLHHCHPGPHDVYTRLLYHYLHMTAQEVMETT